MNGDAFIKLPDPQIDEIQPYVQSLRSVPKSGLHNPLKNPERWTRMPPLSLPVYQCTNWQTRFCHPTLKASFDSGNWHLEMLARPSGFSCRYNMYGDISMRAAEEMRKKEVPCCLCYQHHDSAHAKCLETM